MKYTIEGFQQSKLLEVGLSSNDAIVLRTLKNFYASARMEFRIIDGDKYIWVNQKYLHSQIPIVGSARTIFNILNKLEDKKCIERRLLHERNGIKGNYSYIRLTTIVDSLEDYDPYEKNALGVEKVAVDLVKNLPNKDSSSVLDNSKKTKGESEETLSIKDKNQVVDLWNETATKYNLNQLRLLKAGTQRYQMLKSRIDEYGLDGVLEAINNIKISPFLQGRNDRNWKIDFEWLVRPNNFPKVLEGNYISQAAKQKQQPNKPIQQGDRPLTRDELAEIERQRLIESMKG